MFKDQLHFNNATSGTLTHYQWESNKIHMVHSTIPRTSNRNVYAYILNDFYKNVHSNIIYKNKVRSAAPAQDGGRVGRCYIHLPGPNELQLKYKASKLNNQPRIS